MQKVAKLSELPADSGIRVEIGETPILLVRDGEVVRAYAAQCPHAGAPLEEGILCNGRIVCPWHKAAFRLSDGALMEPPALEGLARYPVRVDGDDIFVDPNAIAERAPKPTEEARVFLIVGAGAAGATAAAALREFGFGGRIVLIGREPGLPYDRTSLSKFVLAGQMPPQETPPLLPAEFYRDQDIERIEAEVSSFDPATRKALLSDGRSFAFDRALIATGAEPRKLDIPGADLPGVHTLRSREDATKILRDVRAGARAVVLGGSFIGLEAAAGLREQGVEVSVVSPEATPFTRQFGERIGGSLRALHEAHGVTFLAPAKASKIEGGGHVEAVVLEDGRRLRADLVVVGVGVGPATNFVRGVERRKDCGLPVDANLRVADGVFAAGDVAAFPAPPEGALTRIEHWRVAQQQARVAARNMLGGSAVCEAPPFFWTYHYGKNFEYLGHADSWDEEIIRGDVEANAFIALLAKGGRVVAVVACERQRATAALSERMRAPLSVDEAAKLIESWGV